nr:MAG: replication associated protein [Cressdnaviricota sp.]
MQGYMVLLKPQRMVTLHTNFNPLRIKLSLIPALGTTQQNYDYCFLGKKKGEADKPVDRPWEHGTFKRVGPGARNDLEDVVETLKVKTLEESALEHPVQFLKFHNGMSKLKNIMLQEDVPKERQLTVTVFWGAARSGKSKMATLACEALGLEYHSLEEPSNNGVLWFDGYTNQKALIIEEFKGWIKPTVFNRILDVYRYRPQIKSGTVMAQWSHIFITSNYPPEEWYREETRMRMDMDAFNGRMHNVYRFQWSGEKRKSLVTISIDKEEKKLGFELIPYDPTTNSEAATATNPTPNSPNLFELDSTSEVPIELDSTTEEDFEFAEILANMGQGQDEGSITSDLALFRKRKRT